MGAVYSLLSQPFNSDFYAMGNAYDIFSIWFLICVGVIGTFICQTLSLVTQEDNYGKIS